MMFSSSPSDKSCINSDSCSPGRNNLPNRVSVGITPLGDENKQIRIQLAVHKYNGTAGSPFNSRCSLMSPIRHSFLKNSLRVRNHEGDAEGPSKTEKRNGNKYEGVGAFPTIHLKKSAVRYRPIKRFHDIKIPYPELPVNRFLSHLPEVCPDLKSSTRSVLDVLEDLSGNKICSKDDSGSCKPKPRGLGGDYLLNPNSVYKPLFVQKPKLNTVLTRDNTTQTFSPVTVETQSPQSSSLHIRNGASDPRAELRRKLAKQNNEIFASLSSSISSAFSLKRKIDKVLPGGDDGQLNGASAQKKTNISDQHSHSHDCIESGLVISVVTPKPSSSDSVKLSRKSKLSETNSVSPNKDRLTAIFLDTRNTSPKAQVFQANASTETKSVEKSSENSRNGIPETNGEDKTTCPSGFCSADDKGKDESGRSPVNFSVFGKSSSCASDQQKTKQPVASVLMSSAHDNTPEKTVKKNLSSLESTETETSNCGPVKVVNTSESTEAGKSASLKESEKEDGNKDSSKTFMFGNSKDRPNFGCLKFGSDGGSPLAQAKSFSGSSSEVVSVAGSVVTNAAPHLSFGATSNVSVPSQTSGVHFGMITTVNTSTVAPKTPFAFGRDTSPSQPSSKSTPSEGKNGTSNAISTSGNITTTTSPGIHPDAYTFCEKASASPAGSEGFMSPATQTGNTVTFGASLKKSSLSGTPSSEGLFIFGQKAETPVTSAAPVQFPFSFGQKPDDAEQNKAHMELKQKNAKPFSSEQKPATQDSTQTSSASTDVATTSNHPATTATSDTAFSQNSAPGISTSFGTKVEGSFLDSIPTPGLTSAFPNKPISFGSSVNGFGKTSAQTTNYFATPASTTFAFGISATTQSTPTFAISSATQSPSTFGPSSTTQSAFGNSSAIQSAPTFGTSTSHSTPGFVVSPTTQPPPTFGVSSASQTIPTFGSSSSSKQSAPSFGITSTTHSTPTFGVSSHPTPPFGTTSATQTTSAFAPKTTFGLSSQSTQSTQSTIVFGAPTSTQSSLRFGAPTSQNNTTFGTSPGFNTSPSPSTQPNTVFGTPTPSPTPAFPSSQSFDNKPITSQTPSIFPQNPTPSNFSNTTFTSNQNNIFSQKPNSETPVFAQNKIQTSTFGPPSQPFASQNKFSFGMSTSNPTAFTTSPSLFSFGGSTTTTAAALNAFPFGNNSSASNTHTPPFAFKAPSNEPFKFGAHTTAATTTTTTTTTTITTTKENTAFGGTPSSTFSFGTQISNNSVPEQKPSFNFGSSQPPSSAPGFHFGTPSPSVFNFGGSTSSSSSGSSFNFGGSTPGGVAFGQTPSPGAPFAVPGTFNIGSGSSQSRPRASSRPRRRP